MRMMVPGSSHPLWHAYELDNASFSQFTRCFHLGVAPNCRRREHIQHFTVSDRRRGGYTRLLRSPGRRHVADHLSRLWRECSSRRYVGTVGALAARSSVWAGRNACDNFTCNALASLLDICAIAKGDGTFLYRSDLLGCDDSVRSP